MAKARKDSVSGKRSSSSKRSRTTAADRTSGAIDAQAIATRAYELFLRRGGAHGHDWADWLAAERELAESPLEPLT